MITASEIRDAKVLIVDDQEPNVYLLTRILTGSGYTSVESTMDPTEVCELHRTNRYDLILLDLTMPGMDGFEVMEGLKEIERDSYLSVLVVTADPDQKLRALTAGAKDFLSKPFDLSEVLTRVQNLLEVRLLHKQLLQSNESLEERVRERTRELRETQMEVIRRLTRATELRDDSTGLHVVRMGLLCERLGSAVGMAPSDCELLLNAGPMHDIGKIGIPDAILLKPGKLTPEEWDVMKTHTTIGADLLADGHSELTQFACVMALSHHERWDGSGYPNGLAGEQIPLLARICGLCDVFDALISDRPYKKAWSVEDAGAHIRDEGGQHFDPNLAELFVEILPGLGSAEWAAAPR
ncbi:MAG: response regulator [Coriobacteriia bacterium]|nr:response regulator [Coriobacteriia bacterium]